MYHVSCDQTWIGFSLAKSEVARMAILSQRCRLEFVLRTELQHRLRLTNVGGISGNAVR